jgi:hypothetical protein
MTFKQISTVVLAIASVLNSQVLVCEAGMQQSKPLQPPGSFIEVLSGHSTYKDLPDLTNTNSPVPKRWNTLSKDGVYTSKITYNGQFAFLKCMRSVEEYRREAEIFLVSKCNYIRTTTKVLSIDHKQCKTYASRVQATG